VFLVLGFLWTRDVQEYLPIYLTQCVIPTQEKPDYQIFSAGFSHIGMTATEYSHYLFFSHCLIKKNLENLFFGSGHRLHEINARSYLGHFFA